LADAKSVNFRSFFFRFAEKKWLHGRGETLRLKVASKGLCRAGAILIRVNEENKDRVQLSVGLCADCRFMRRHESDRGSTFYLCERSATDATFPKYPRLPVLRCAGYEPLGAERER
jgi:hypothetical protein